MDIFSIFFNIKVHRGDSKECTQYTIFNIEKENHPKLSQICSYGIISKGLKNKLETAMVYRPSVVEPLKVYCISIQFECLLQIIIQSDH